MLKQRMNTACRQAHIEAKRQRQEMLERIMLSPSYKAASDFSEAVSRAFSSPSLLAFFQEHKPSTAQASKAEGSEL